MTENEILVMVAMRNNDYSDILESEFGDWSFAVCDCAKLDPKVYRGVVSSLIQKGIVEVFGKGNNASVAFTQDGKKRWVENEN